jgi:hypothetical protein
MKYEEALQKIEGAQSVGGQLIAVQGGVHVLVGKAVQGELIVEDTPAAKKIMEAAESGAPVTHDVHVQDVVVTTDVTTPPTLPPADAPREAAPQTEVEPQPAHKRK